MTQSELNTKISATLEELNSNIIDFVKENAKYEIGDVVKSSLNPSNYFVITQLGFDTYHGIVYYGSRITKTTGEVSTMDMDSNVGTPERCITKATLIVKKEEISFIKECRYFNYKIKTRLS